MIKAAPSPPLRKSSRNWPAAAAAAVGGEAPVGADEEAACADRRSRRCAGARRGPARVPPCAAPGRCSRTVRDDRAQHQEVGNGADRRDLEQRGRLDQGAARPAGHAQVAPEGDVAHRLELRGRQPCRHRAIGGGRPRTTISSRHSGSEPTRLPRVWPKARGPIMKSTTARSSALRVGSQVNSSTTCGASAGTDAGQHRRQELGDIVGVLITKCTGFGRRIERTGGRQEQVELAQRTAQRVRPGSRPDR